MGNLSIRNGALGLGMAAIVAISTPLVMSSEGRSLVSYLDPVGIPTICDGITSGVQLGQTATDQDCDRLLAHELGQAVAAVDKNVRVPLGPYQRAAFGSFVYNVGESKFQKSTILRMLNSGDVEGACNQLPRWIYAGGKVLGGLVRRRQAEKALCLVGIYSSGKSL